MLRDTPTHLMILQKLVFGDPLLEEKANSHQNGKVYTPEDMWRVSTYLVMEEAHPCIFPMLVDRPERLPSD